ncbi:UNVERIFIED_CONTAM: rhamnan synthesis F family protein, partial [Microbacterium sp. SLM126]
NVQPRVLNADAAMLEVLPDVDTSYDPTTPLRIAAVIHVRDLARIDDLLDRYATLPEGTDLIVTTTSHEDADHVRSRLSRRADLAPARREVRVVQARAGRDMSAFFVTCADVLRDERYDLIVKIHSMKRAGIEFNARRYFRRHQLENLLSSSGYVRNVLGLFQREPGLGVVFPPMVHIGFGTMGRAWADYRETVADWCKRLGIRVPLDDASPLAPYGGMWIARREALAILTDHPWTYSDYRRKEAQAPADLPRIQERLVALACGELGYHVRTVLNTEHASISHTALEEKVDQLFSTTPGYPVEQIQFLHRAGWAGHGGPLSLARMYLRMNHPRVSRVAEPGLHLAWRAMDKARRVRDRMRGRRSSGVMAVESSRV